MSAIVHTFYYADAPSPLHDALAAHDGERVKLIEQADALAASVGAVKAVAGHSVAGFIFVGGAPKGWKEIGTLRNQTPYYAPPRRSRADKALHREMASIRFDDAIDYIVSKCGLTWMTWGGNSMWRTTAGFKDGRIFVKVPTGGDGNNGLELAIPPYLTPCREWEMQRWFDEGRAACEVAP